MNSIYTIAPISQTLNGGQVVSWTVPFGIVFVLRDVTAGTVAAPANPPLDVILGALTNAPVIEWKYAAGVQVFHYDGRIACPAGTVISARNNMGVSTLYVAITGYSLTA